MSISIRAANPMKKIEQILLLLLGAQLKPMIKVLIAAHGVINSILIGSKMFLSWRIR